MFVLSTQLWICSHTRALHLNLNLFWIVLWSKICLLLYTIIKLISSSTVWIKTNFDVTIRHLDLMPSLLPLLGEMNLKVSYLLI